MILLSMILPILRRRFAAEIWAMRDDGHVERSAVVVEGN